MCLLIFAHRADPRYPLVLAGNRDEFHDRLTAAARFWPDKPGLLAGRDLEQGGTWMGITRGGRFAAITNYRDPSRTAPAPRSRGELPLNYLVGTQEPGEYLQGLLPVAEAYAGFNLLVGVVGELWYLTNSLPAGERAPLCLQPGIYGLSNARLDTPWPKVTRGKGRLETLLRAGTPDHAGLARVVGDRQLADSTDLSRQGLDGDMDRILSAQFITTARYGTRSSTTLWVENGGLTHWRESSFNPAGEPVEQHEESFVITGD
ncbi:MAG: NRDE family protein [Pseudomonadales bacterium]|nr:NRDE family protein [Pseudomonadales bacterium]